MHRASGHGRGKPVLICILACSLAFHAITFERSSYPKIAFFKNETSVAINSLVSLFCCPVACGGRKCGNRQTDTQIKYRTLAAHVRRGLTTNSPRKYIIMDHMCQYNSQMVRAM